MKAPASAINPPAAHAPKTKIVGGTCCATTYGLMKMPEPMTPPITIIVVSNKPSRRANCDSGDDVCAMSSVMIRIELNHETRNTVISETLLLSQTLGAERENYLSRGDDRRRIRARRSLPYRPLTLFVLRARPF